MLKAFQKLGCNIAIKVLFLFNHLDKFTPKSTQETLTKLARIFSYIKSSFIIFLVKTFGYSHYIYYLKAESTRFHKRFFINEDILSHIDFRTILSLHMSQNILITPHCILLTYTKSILLTFKNFHRY